MKVKDKLREMLLKITGFILILFQYVPITSIWYGVMSLPLIGFMFYFFQQPGILLLEMSVFLRSFECYIIISKINHGGSNETINLFINSFILFLHKFIFSMAKL